MADLIGNFDRRHVEKTLRSFAQAAGLTGGRCDFVVAGDALLPQYRIDQTPGLAERVRAFHGRLTMVRLPFAADAILFKTNMRIMGLVIDGERLSAKVMLNTAEQESSLVREVRARRIAAEILRDNALLGVPAVHSWDRASRRWLVEEQIDGPQAPPPALQGLLSERLAPFYAASVRSRALHDGVKGQRLAAALAEIRRLGVLPPVNGGSRWAVAFVHGDLVPTNVVASAQKLWLVDWEYGGRGPVCFDLGGMCAMEPALIPMALHLLRGLVGTGELTAEVQLAIGMADHLAKRRAARAQEITSEMRMKKLPQGEAARLVDLRMAQMETAIRRLLNAGGLPGLP